MLPCVYWAERHSSSMYEATTIKIHTHQTTYMPDSNRKITKTKHLLWQQDSETSWLLDSLGLPLMNNYLGKCQAF
jgi:hypothetical protein